MKPVRPCSDMSGNFLCLFRECKAGWELLVDVTGCASCAEDVQFFSEELKAACSKLQNQVSCESSAGTSLAGEAICNHASGRVAEDAPGAFQKLAHLQT